jgi:hypothetical protein
MKKLSLVGFSLLVFVLFAIPAYLGFGVLEATEEWIAFYNGPSDGRDSPQDFAVDPSGNVYVTGRSPGSGTGNDFATIKYDTNGNELWVARYDGPGHRNDSVSAIAVDSSGSVYITGESFGEGLRQDYATIKYDENGNELWVARKSRPDGSSVPRKIALDPSGNVYVAGWPYIIKYDNSGSELWAVRVPESENEVLVLFDMAVDSIGNVYGTGWYNEKNPYNESYGTIKIDTNGNQLWFAKWDFDIQEWATVIELDSSGNVFVSGYGYGYSSTIKYDTNGNELWVEYWPRGNYPHDIEVDSSGNVYVTGTLDTIKYDNDGNELWFVQNYENGLSETYDVDIAFGGVYLSGAGYGDYATTKFDTSGNLQWIKLYNGPGNRYDSALGNAIDSLGNIYVTGSSQSSRYYHDDDFCTIKYSQQLTPEEKIYGLIDDVNGLVDEGKLLPDKSGGLIGKLEEALKALDKANPNVRVACNKLSDFIDQVNSCIQSGAIPDPADGQALIDAANAIISELCG